jgi:murein DD-endopeptidase MepM/ murein hydrolase activator NlpD
MGLGQIRPGLLLLLAALGCASAGRGSGQPMHSDHLPGTWHFVAEGETAVSIARAAGIPLEDFLEINGLRKNDALEPGRPVFLLAPSRQSTTLATPDAGPPPASVAAVPVGARVEGSKAPLRWPVAAPRLTSRFGKRWGRDHEGIDMAAPIGTPVYAAASGSVMYAGDRVRGYGNMVVVRHNDGLVTVYAHNSLLLVHTGDLVAVGQEIARVGDTGRSTAPHLHFEVRRGENPQDPLQFLPALK